MGIIVYGIKNCNTVKKALDWLTSHNVPFTFHDFKSKGLSIDTLKQWIGQQGLETLINKKGTTYKQLNDEEKEIVFTSQGYDKILSKTSIIKRPVIEENDKIIFVGFDEKEYERIFQRISQN